MTSGAPAGSPGGAPRRFGYREWPPHSPSGSSSTILSEDSSIESSRVGNNPRSYEMSEQGASARSSTTTMADQSRPNEGSGAQPPPPASSSLVNWPPSPESQFRPLQLRSSSSSSLFHFSDGSSSPLIRPGHHSVQPAVPPSGDQFHYLPQRPTHFRYASHSAQTPSSGFFNPRPILFDQASQTSPVSSNPVRQRSPPWRPRGNHRQPSGAVRPPVPGYSRSSSAAPSPFRPVGRGRALRPASPSGTPSSGSPPPTVFTVSPPPPYEAISSAPRSQSLGGPAVAASSPSSSAELGAWRSRSPLWPQIPPTERAPTSGASSASSTPSVRILSRATSPTYAAVVSGAESAAPGAASSGGLPGGTLPPVATTTAMSGSSVTYSQVRFQLLLLLRCVLAFSLYSLCSPGLSTPLDLSIYPCIVNRVSFLP